MDHAVAPAGGEDEDVVTVQTLVVGGGLSGATAFYELASHYVNEALSSAGESVGSCSIALVEARDRCGGRSCTTTVQPKKTCNEPPVKVDVGGQWLGTCHTEMLSLCEMLGLELEEQEFPPAIKRSSYDGKATNAPTEEDSLIEMAYYQLKQVSSEAKQEMHKFESFLQGCYKRLNGLLRLVAGGENAHSIKNNKQNRVNIMEATMRLLKEEQAWDKISFHDMVCQHCLLEEARQQYAYFCQTVVAIDSTKCSFLFFLYYVYVWGSGDVDGMVLLGDGPDGMQALKVKGGTQQISEGLIKKALDISKRSRDSLRNVLDAKVYYECEVQRVDCDSHPAGLVVVTCAVRVTTNTGETNNWLTVPRMQRKFHCQNVVLAMSPTLFSKTIVFRPELNQERKLLYDSLVMGCAIKVVVAFTEAFWRDTLHDEQRQDGANSQLVQQMSIDEVGLVSNIFESNVGQYPALICLLTGHHASKYHNTGSNKERQELILSQLRTMYPSYNRSHGTGTSEKSVQMIAYIEKDWMAEQYSGGCFAAVVKPTDTGVFAKYKHLLHRPIVPGRVFVAGTESSTHFFGYLEGAALAGKRAALEARTSTI